MLSRLAFRCSSRFTLNEPIAVGERDSTEPLRPASGAPSTTAHRGLKTGGLWVSGSSLRTVPTLRTPTADSCSRLDPPFRGPWSLTPAPRAFCSPRLRLRTAGRGSHQREGGSHGTTHGAQRSKGHPPGHLNGRRCARSSTCPLRG